MLTECHGSSVPISHHLFDPCTNLAWSDLEQVALRYAQVRAVRVIAYRFVLVHARSNPA